MIEFIIFIVSFFASVIGAISGIGGGIIIKPVIEMLNVLSSDALHFLSGMTVLSMTTVALLTKGSQKIHIKISLFLAIGSAIGGFVGHSIFVNLSNIMQNNLMGILQNGCLLIINCLVLVYMKHKASIKTLQYSSIGISLLIGFLLGTLSSFLGIGGGPLNLIVLYYFYSFTAKEAAMNSLFLIFFAQFTSFVSTVFTNQIPDVDSFLMITMMVGGVSGALIGKQISLRLKNHHVEKLFNGLMLFIILVNLYNIYSYLVL